MHADFWHERWRNNQIGFHEPAVHPLLAAHFPALSLPPASRIFLPLCGKTLDIDWLLARGHRVAGAELSALAVTQLFERLRAAPSVRKVAALECWSTEGLDVFVGDMFTLDEAALGAVDAVYDRAALIALPPDMRRRYAASLSALTRGAAQLLVTLDYDPQCMDGPPFPVGSAEVHDLYAGRAPALLASHEVAGGLKGRCPATENAWLLRAVLATVNPG